MSRFAVVLSAAAALATAAAAQTPAPSPAPAAPPIDHSKMDHSKMDHAQHAPAAPAATDSAATKAFKEANDRMHADMAIAFTNDADADFVKGMLPHHQGAVDMAKIVLKHGKDPEVRKLAAAIIKAQDTEIAFMKAWLKKKGK
jgi:uncharacterized protein (DUF305 family)